jgi:ribosomal protein L37E
MPQPHNFDPSQPPVGQRRCPTCGFPMFLSRIDPADKVGHDQRTFECATCAYAETVTVKFR